jgi:hypothetical protein
MSNLWQFWALGLNEYEEQQFLSNPTMVIGNQQMAGVISWVFSDIIWC